MPQSRMPGLYLHIPFCVKKCHYCDFVISVDRSQSARQRFFSAISRELSWARQTYGPLGFDTFYLGGGTPSSLSAEEMEFLVKAVQKIFGFKPGFEFTCEFNPGDADAQKIKAFHDLGINRVSLGAQAFQDNLLKNMGRWHTTAEIRNTAALIQNAGILNISMDLILGLPYQTLWDLEESLQSCVDLNAAQFSLYDLDIHEKTLWGHQSARRELNLPDENHRAEQFELADSFLQKAGYLPYEISTFARPGFESRHNLNYWHNGEYLGLGPGAFSYMKGLRYQMASSVGRYVVKCEAGDFDPDTKDWITPEENEKETLLTGLRLREGISLEHFSILKIRFEDRFNQLLKDGLVEKIENRFRLTRRGRFLAESVLAFAVS